MKKLYVGDPHATPDSLDEMWKLIDYIIQIVKEDDVHQVVFLGDLYHTHSIIHLSVQTFWQKAFDKIIQETGARLLTLVGNHDKSGAAGSIENALSLHTGITVVQEPLDMGGVLYVPYVSDPDEFVEICRKFPEAEVLVCHQTFDGSQYENGFYAKDGVDQNLIPQSTIISGHIHTPQELGRVWYPGAPRWRTVSDANVERALWVVDHDGSGRVVGKHPRWTKGVCRPIYVVKDTPDCPAVLPDDGSVTVDVYGPPDYIKQRKLELYGIRSDIRTRDFATQERNLKVKESDGMVKAMEKFFAGYKPKNGTPPEKLWQLAQERVSWLKT